MTAVRIATRASELALWQARYVAGRIERELGRAAELVPLTTTGDQLRDVSLAKVGGKGLFVKEIEEALLDGRADVAVHSAKDLPGESPEQLVFAAFPERADARDALVSRGAARLDDLPRGARVGTGSARRSAQLLRERPDLRIAPLRGNVPTRLAKLEREGLDALVLACAGLDRLGLSDRIAERIDPARLVPAVAQGALAIQARRGDPLAAELAALAHPGTAARVAAERACQARLHADCNVPLGAHAVLAGDRIALRVRLLAPDGGASIERAVEGDARDPDAIGWRAADQVLAAGGAALLDELRAQGAA
ncbi:MAG TPA: hydroxymethylbilane synthase [Myxococcota bacterium]|nr:hydroxymethylbilane synthase [Myxococcota bacterium]